MHDWPDCCFATNCPLRTNALIALANVINLNEILSGWDQIESSSSATRLVSSTVFCAKLGASSTGFLVNLNLIWFWRWLVYFRMSWQTSITTSPQFQQPQSSWQMYKFVPSLILAGSWILHSSWRALIARRSCAGCWMILAQGSFWARTDPEMTKLVDWFTWNCWSEPFWVDNPIRSWCCPSASRIPREQKCWVQDPLWPNKRSRLA